MANYPGAEPYPLLANRTPMVDDGPWTKGSEVSIPRGPGVKPYPLLTNRTPMVDDGPWTKGREVSIPRGGSVADFNANIRGAGVRIDKKPKRPYP